MPLPQLRTVTHRRFETFSIGVCELCALPERSWKLMFSSGLHSMFDDSRMDFGCFLKLDIAGNQFVELS